MAEWPITPMNEQECQTSSHAQAKGTTRAVAVVRASTGLTTHRPASARVRVGCHGSQDPPAGRNRKLVCEPHDSTGEPGAGNRHAGFGERGEETCPRDSDCGPVRKRRMSHRLPTGYAPPLDSTSPPNSAASSLIAQSDSVELEAHHVEALERDGPPLELAIVRTLRRDCHMDAYQAPELREWRRELVRLARG